MGKCDTEGCGERPLWSLFSRDEQFLGATCGQHQVTFFRKKCGPGITARRYEKEHGELHKEVDQKAKDSGRELADYDPGPGLEKSESQSGRLPTPRARGGQVFHPAIRSLRSGELEEHRAGEPESNSGVVTSPQEVLTPYGGAGTLELSDAQVARLLAKADPADVEIRPNGLVFMPWVKTARVWDEVFRPGLWALVPLARPLIQDHCVCVHVALVVQGKYVGEAVGEQIYHPNNPNMTWATCIESAHSDAISRLAKRLGMWRELWDRRWIRDWQEENAVRVYCQGKKPGWYWRRKDDPPLPGEGKPGKAGESEYDRPMRLIDELGEHFDNIE